MPGGFTLRAADMEFNIYLVWLARHRRRIDPKLSVLGHIRGPESRESNSPGFSLG